MRCTVVRGSRSTFGQTCREKKRDGAHCHPPPGRPPRADPPKGRGGGGMGVGVGGKGGEESGGRSWARTCTQRKGELGGSRQACCQALALMPQRAHATQAAARATYHRKSEEFIIGILRPKHFLLQPPSRPTQYDSTRRGQGFRQGEESGLVCVVLMGWGEGYTPLRYLPPRASPHPPPKGLEWRGGGGGVGVGGGGKGGQLCARETSTEETIESSSRITSSPGQNLGYS